MLKLLGSLLKILAFSLVVLIIGNWLRWDGKTISDQVKTQLSAAERSDVADHVRDMAKKVTTDAKKGFQKIKTDGGRSTNTGMNRGQGVLRPGAEDEIPASERQKLKALIEELNPS